MSAEKGDFPYKMRLGTVRRVSNTGTRENASESRANGAGIERIIRAIESPVVEEPLSPI